MIPSFVRSFIHLFVHSFISNINAHIHSIIYSFIPSFFHLFIRLFIYLSIHSFISLTHPFVDVVFLPIFRSSEYDEHGRGCDEWIGSRRISIRDHFRLAFISRRLYRKHGVFIAQSRRRIIAFRRQRNRRSLAIFENVFHVAG